MNGNNNSNSFVLRLRGFSGNISPIDVENFLQGCQIRQVILNEHNSSDNSTECFVLFESKEDFDLGKTFDQKLFANRPIDVLESNIDEIGSNPNRNDFSPNENVETLKEPVVRIRGLSYNATKDDVRRFFKGLEIAPNGIHISTSKPFGEAFVAFVNIENAIKALSFNRLNSGNRYIEVLKSTYNDARAAIINDTEMLNRQRSGANNNPNYHSQRSGNHPHSGGHHNGPSSYDNNYNNNHHYNGPPANNYTSFSGQNNNYSMQNHGGVKQPMSISFTMKIRGVPFESGEKEVFEFFNPIVPIRLEQENTPRGKPPIWYAEFGSREEATEALTFHNQHIGTRYIELLPLYEDVNRPKTNRN